jgi:hypothetical protein
MNTIIKKGSLGFCESGPLSYPNHPRQILKVSIKDPFLLPNTTDGFTPEVPTLASETNLECLLLFV